MVQEEEELGKERVRKAMSCCEQQADQGGVYLHKHSKRSTSWDMPEVQEMLKMAGHKPDVSVRHEDGEPVRCCASGRRQGG